MQTVLAMLGWCTLINIGLLALSTIMLVLFRPSIIRIHQSLTGLNEEVLQRAYFHYLALFKILIVVFNLVPYLALRIAMNG